MELQASDDAQRLLRLQQAELAAQPQPAEWPVDEPDDLDALQEAFSGAQVNVGVVERREDLSLTAPDTRGARRPPETSTETSRHPNPPQPQPAPRVPSRSDGQALSRHEEPAPAAEASFTTWADAGDGQADHLGAALEALERESTELQSRDDDRSPGEGAVWGSVEDRRRYAQDSNLSSRDRYDAYGGESQEDDHGGLEVVPPDDSHRFLHHQRVREKRELDPTPGDQTSLAAMTEVARRGGVQRIVVARLEPGGPIELLTSPSTRYNGARVEEFQSPDAVAAEAANRQQSSVALQGEVVDDDPIPYVGRYSAWTNLTPRNNTLTSETNEPSEEMPDGLKLGELFNGPTEPVIAVYELHGITEEGHHTLLYGITKALEQAEGDGKKLALQDLQMIQEKVHLGLQTAGVEVTVQVGVQHPEHLPLVLPQVQQMLPTDNQSWRPQEREHSYVYYPDRLTALARRPMTPDAYQPIGQVHRDVRLVVAPGQELSGLAVDPAFHFSVEQRLPKDAETIDMGLRFDDYGNVAGALKLLVEQATKHVGFFGESGSGKSTAAEDYVIAQFEANIVKILEEVAAGIPIGEGTIPLSMIAVDQMKGGVDSVWTQPFLDAFAHRLAQRNLPLQFAIANTVRPGEGGLRFRIDLTNPAGGSAAQQVMLTLKAVLAGAGNGEQLDPESERMLLRYLKDGVIDAHVVFGDDLELRVQTAPVDGPPNPPLRFIARRSRSQIRQSGYEPKVQENVGTFVGGTVENQLVLVPGEILDDRATYALHFDKIIDPMRRNIPELIKQLVDQGLISADQIDTNLPIAPITTIELDLMSESAAARGMTTAAVIGETVKQVDLRHERLGMKGDFSKQVEVIIVLDEVDIFKLNAHDLANYS